MPLSALAHETPYRKIFIIVKIPGLGLSGAEPGLRLASDRAARGRRESLVLAVRFLLTADTAHCKCPSLQPFPSGKGQEADSPGHCRLPGGDKGRNSWVSRPGAGGGAGAGVGALTGGRAACGQPRSSRPLPGLQFF